MSKSREPAKYLRWFMQGRHCIVDAVWDASSEIPPRCLTAREIMETFLPDDGSWNPGLVVWAIDKLVENSRLQLAIKNSDVVYI